MSYRKFDKIYIFLFFIALLCLSCEERFKYKDNFYNKTGGSDYKRLPLIKPFEMWSTGNIPNYWYYQLKSHNIKFTSQIAGSEVSVSDAFIIIHYKGGYQQVKSLADPEKFYLVDTKRKLEYEFNRLQELTTFLSNNQFDSNKISFYNLDSIYTQFNQTGRLPWVSDNH